MTPRQLRAAEFLATKGIDVDGITALVEYVTAGRLCRLEDCTDTDMDRLAELSGGLGVDVHVVPHLSGHRVILGTPLFGNEVAS